jgi:ribosomal-protein-alanine N-acetyltransferase
VGEVALPDGIEIRSLRPEDVNAVVAIETDAFSAPWKNETFMGLIGRDTVELLVMTHEVDGVIGYAVLWCILDQGELANLAVAPTHRGEGLGALLLHRVVDAARHRGVEKLFLEVRASNEAALALYSGFGFVEVGQRKGYYESPKEDARVMLVSFGD